MLSLSSFFVFSLFSKTKNVFIYAYKINEGIFMLIKISSSKLHLYASF